VKISDFKQDFSRSAFKTIDGSRRVVGKWCEIEALTSDNNGPDVFDIWIVRPDREPIGTRKLNNIIRAIEALPEYSAVNRPIIERLDGEAYLQTPDRALVREVAFLCGVKRKKRYSEATLQKKRDQLVKFRKDKPAGAGSSSPVAGHNNEVGRHVCG